MSTKQNVATFCYSKSMKIVKKAGGIVINSDGKVLIVTNIIGRITLPKGSLEPGESHEQAANREVLEESGLKSVELIKELGIIERPGFTEDNDEIPTVIKQITMYLFKTSEHILQPDIKDIIEAEWVNPDELGQLLSWQEEIDFFEQHRSDIVA